MDSYRCSKTGKLSFHFFIHRCLKQVNKVLFQFIMIYKVVSFHFSFVYKPDATFKSTFLQTV